MAVAKLLGFDLCPRLRDLAEKVVSAGRIVVPENIVRVTVKRLSRKAIREGWDELLRLIASIRIGKIGADLALRFLSSAAQGDPAYRTAEHLGRLCERVAQRHGNDGRQAGAADWRGSHRLPRGD